MNYSNFKKKPVATLDTNNHRYVIRNLSIAGNITPSAALRAVKETHISWRQVAKFFGLPDQTTAFKAAYCTNKPTEFNHLQDLLTVAGDVAYFYDAEHQPASVDNPTVHPTITNNEPNLINVQAKVPVNVTSRIVVKDPLDRSLHMTITTTNGVLIGAGKLYTKNSTVELRGNAKRLNNYLAELQFVGTAAGNGNVSILVDDLSGKAEGLLDTEVNIKVKATKSPSIPTITVPDGPSVTLGKDTLIQPPVTVYDEDGKMLKLRVSPFGCDILGFKGFLGYIKPNEVKTIYGTHEFINDYISTMKMRAYQKDAQVGFELICGTYKTRKYLVATVTEEGEDTPTPQPNSTVGTAQVDTGTVGTDTNTTNTTNTTSSPKSTPKVTVTTGKGNTTTTTDTSATTTETPKDAGETTTPKS